MDGTGRRPELKAASAREWLALTAITALAAALRFHGLGRESIWLDEALSVRLARTPPGGLLAATGLDGHPPLYLFLLRCWMGLFGGSEAAVRSLSAVAGVLAVPVIHFLGRRLFGVAAGLAAALLLAVNSYHIYYGQEARNYSLLVLTTLLSWAAYERDAARPTRGSGALYVAATALLLYTHVYALLVVAAQVLYGAYVRLRGGADKASWRRFLLLNAALGACLVPWIGAPWTGLLARQADAARTGLALARPGLDALATSFVQQAGAPPLLLALGAAAAAAALRRLRVGEPVVVGLLLWLWLPHLVPFVWAQVSVPVYITRSTIVALPALCLLAAAGLADLRAPLRVAALAACAGVALWYQYLYFGLVVKEQWRAVAADVRSWAQPGDVVAFDQGYGQTGFDHYAAREEIPRLALPTDVREPGAAAPLDASPAPRVWLVRFQRPPDPDGVARALAPAFDVVGWKRYVGIDLYLFRRRAAAAPTDR